MFLLLNISLIYLAELFLLVLHSFFYHLIKLFGLGFLLREGKKNISAGSLQPEVVIYTCHTCLPPAPRVGDNGEVLSAPFLPAAPPVTAAHVALRHRGWLSRYWVGALVNYQTPH